MNEPNQLPTDYQTIIHKLHYARWLEEEQRRENWNETVSRYIEFFKNYITKNYYTFNDDLWPMLYQSIYSLDVMPSMRGLWVAGSALERDLGACYNCSFMSVDSLHVFGEACYLSMLGCGVAYSVERQYICQLPTVPHELHPTDTTIVVRDSRIGWANAIRETISLLYSGVVPHWDFSKIRPMGARLKNFGGRASGSRPLEKALHFIVKVFQGAKGRKLNSLECHDILCNIGEMVVAGGTRRSALLSLSNLSDLRMRDAKTGDWRSSHQYRDMSNNSVAYSEKPGMGIFMEEWKSLYDSKSGERGIFNRDGTNRRIMLSGRREPYADFGCNSCAEIILRSAGLCNLSAVTVTEDDTQKSILKKIEIATIFGTFQSTLTKFRYLRPIWQKNAEEERLLGVSITGICDNIITSDPDVKFLEEMKTVAIDTNKHYAEKLGINQSVAVTTVKPSGNSSQLLNSSSGIHPRYAPYYVRGIQVSQKDPMSDFLAARGVPWEVYEMKPDSTNIFYFPQKSPKHSISRKDMTALQQLELVAKYQKHYVEHNVSATIYVRESEWLEVGAWVYRNFDDISGLSFLPYSEEDHGYKQLPYRECSEEEYKAAMAKMPENINWEDFKNYEREDVTTGAREFACSGNSCELT